jgi:xylono-1,5-lactonase
MRPSCNRSQIAFQRAMATIAQLWIKADHRLGESIIWHAARQCYFWVDLLDPALFSHDPTTAQTTKRVFPIPAPIGSIAATTDDNLLILAHRGGLSLLDINTMALTPYCDPEAGRDEVIYNDIKVDRWGRLWVGTSHAREQQPRGALWCVKDRMTWALADAGFAISNGPAFSLDGKTMYFNDSAHRMTFAYDIAPDHLNARNRRVFVQHGEGDGLPDGCVVDASDHLWTAQWAGHALLRFDRNGRLKERIAVPSVHVTTLCFGGQDLRQMKITTATDGAPPEERSALPLSGSLFASTGGWVGLPEPLFALSDIPRI